MFIGFRAVAIPKRRISLLNRHQKLNRHKKIIVDPLHRLGSIRGNRHAEFGGSTEASSEMVTAKVQVTKEQAYLQKSQAGAADWAMDSLSSASRKELLPPSRQL
jgi:hypothetical protein